MHMFIEINHDQDNRDEDKIMKLKQDIRDNVKLLSELGLLGGHFCHVCTRVECSRHKNKNSRGFLMVGC